MADKKITQLNNITGANLAEADEFVVVDITADETKAITFSELKTAFDTGTGFVRITGDTMTGNLSLGDNNKAIFGTGGSSPQLQIYTDGSNSYIDDAGAGRLNIRGANDLAIKNTNNDTYIYCVADGQVQLYHNDETKLTTTSTGIDVTGTVTADGLTVDGVTSSFDTTPSTSGLQLHFETDTGLGSIGSYVSGGAGLGFYTNTGTDPLKQRIKISGGGDISFYEATGTTPKFHWDAADQRLGLGTSSPDRLLTLQGDNSYMWMKDAGGGNVAFIGGDGSNDGFLRLYNGSHTAKVEIQSDGNTYFNGGNVGIGTSSPNKTLTVAKAQTASTAMEVLRLTGSGAYTNGTDSTNAGAALSFGQYNTTYPNWNLAQIDGIRTGSSWGGSLVFRTNNNTAQTNSTEAMRIDSSGRVGIGTSSIATRLHVKSSGGVGTSTTFETDAPSSAINFKNTGSSTNAYLGSTGTSLYFATNSAERMRIDSSGNVGIGQTPSATGAYIQSLQIGEQANLYAHIQGVGAGSSTYLSNNITNNSGPKYIKSDSGSEYVQQSGNHSWFTYPSGTAGATATASESMRIDSSGRVGIGTSSPNQLLEVSGNGAKTRFMRSGSTGTTVEFFSGASKAGGIQVQSTGLGIAGGVRENDIFIDTSGNLLVGKTTGAFATAGTKIQSDGQTEITASNGGSLYLNRLSSDGLIVGFYKNSSSVGSIGTTGGDFYLTKSGSNQTGIYFNELGMLPMTSGSISDNSRDIGQSGYRWNDLYLGGGIYLGGTGSANKLEDYEEGTWNLTDVSGAGLSLTVYVATYTKIGNQVFFEIGIVFPTTSNTSPIKLSLPFLVKNSADNTGGGAITTTSSGRTGDSVLALRNDTKLALSTNLNQNVLNSNFSGKQLRVAGQYTTSA